MGNGWLSEYANEYKNEWHASGQQDFSLPCPIPVASGTHTCSMGSTEASKISKRYAVLLGTTAPQGNWKEKIICILRKRPWCFCVPKWSCLGKSTVNEPQLISHLFSLLSRTWESYFKCELILGRWSALILSWIKDPVPGMSLIRRS